MLTGTERRWKSKLWLSPRGDADIFEDSIRKVILNLSLEFDKSTFSLNVECQVERKGKEGDGGGVY